MPIYVMTCGKCGLDEERLFQSQKSFEDYNCPQCGSHSWIKKPQRTAWFLGRGFLQKDSASEVAEMGYGKPTGGFNG